MVLQHHQIDGKLFEISSTKQLMSKDSCGRGNDLGYGKKDEI